MAKVSIDDIFYADNRWISLMNNKIYYKEFVKAILKHSTIGKVLYRGAVLYSDSNLEITGLIDSETHDIIHPHNNLFNPVKGQDIFDTFSSYLEVYPPKLGYYNFYYIGDLSEKTEEGYHIHWNCFIIKNLEHKGIYVLDPSISDEPGGYNFNIEKKKEIINAINYHLIGTVNALLAMTFKPKESPQQVCNPAYSCVDSFCQTWVLFLTDGFIQNRIDDIRNLEFSKFSSLVLKSWLYCLILSEPSLKSWMAEFKTKLMLPFKYCRLPLVVSKQITTEKRQIESLKKKPNQTCIHAVLEMFS